MTLTPAGADPKHEKVMNEINQASLEVGKTRDCSAAHSGLDPDGARREQLLQCIFVLYKYATGKPRRAGRARIKPGSARAPLGSLRRIHKRNGTTIIAAPAMSTLMKGLLREYVRILVPAPAKVATTEKVPFGRCARLRAGAAIGRPPGARVITADQGPHRARSTRARGSDISNGVTQFTSRV